MYHFGVSEVKPYLTIQSLRRSVVRVVYVQLFIQMIEQLELQSLHIKVVHVPLYSQCS